MRWKGLDMPTEHGVVALPAKISTFAPVAYYDKHMDCIRVITHDRSLTERRIDNLFTVYTCNHRKPFDPEYIGFSIKGVRHLFDEVGLSLDGVYRLSEVIDKIVKHRPGSAMSELMKIIFNGHQSAGDLEVELNAA
jgi:hypothetical protein